MVKLMISLLIISIFAISCSYQHRHLVGNGSQTGVTLTRKQWYALWGLVPVNDVDVERLAGGSENYEIYTRSNAGDFFINLFTGIIGFTSRTVTVRK
ncbi:Bor/Iss family lipoprotein [Brachyspira intermedia]|uniref:Bor/Iss family lipoprotein n=1 Tax=Brachyspira intermedia TaxID=84377 RepID=UPI003007DC71